MSGLFPKGYPLGYLRTAELLEVLREAEWAGTSGALRCCPWCRGVEGIGHMPECRWVAAVEGVR